jgi:hypothetical protein
MAKKEFRKEIEAKLDTAFGHMAAKADKKFRKLLKKAAHILADGLHQPDTKAVKKKAAKKAVAKSKPVVKKAAPLKKTSKSSPKKK